MAPGSEFGSWGVEGSLETRINPRYDIWTRMQDLSVAGEIVYVGRAALRGLNITDVKVQYTCSL